MKLPLGPTAVTALLLLALPGSAQVHASETPAPKPAPPAAEPADHGTPPAAANSNSVPAGSLGEPRVFRFEDMPAHKTANGGESRILTHGTLRSGESVNLHESIQPGGAEPVPLHVIHHTEFICVQQGQVTFDHVDETGNTVSEQAGPGSVVYVASGTNHRIRNTGPGPAQYVVIAIGGDAK